MATDVRSTRRQPASRPAKGSKRPKKRRSRWWRFRRPLFVVLFLILALLAGGAYSLSRIPLPTAPVLSQTTLVYDSQGNQLASFSSSEARVDVSLRQVPQVVIDAVVATEDRHFFTEGAVNPVSTIRAAINDLRGGSLQGGSTITQQYVKITYAGTQRTILRKLKEAVLAEKLQRKYTKDQILGDYLNTIYFGEGAYGIEAASETYFGEPIDHLGLAQASLLAGLIHDPTGDDPKVHPAAAEARQGQVLKAMLTDHKISEAQLQAVEATPMASYLSPTTSLTSGIYVNVKDGDQFFVDAVRQQLIAQYGQARVYSGGLRVTTTLNPTLQTEGYNAIYGPGALNPAAGTPAGALVSVDDQGNVRAMVGGQNYGKGYSGISQVNLAMGTEGGGSGRQAGSTFKAFLLAVLVKEGYSVESVVPAPPEVVVAHGDSSGGNWDVKNYEGEAPPSGMLSIVDATAQSVNTVFAQLVERIGPQKLEDMAIAMGINPAELGAYPSLVLGTASVSPLEMASAYSTFASNGVHTTPSLITKVTTAGGQALPFPKPTSSTVLTPAQDEVVNYVLQQVVQEGTGETATGAGVPVAGKTGTTDMSTDAWFIGYTPTLTTAVWEGYLKGNTPLPGKAVGGGLPTTMWTNYMRAALRYVKGIGGQSFAEPYSLGAIPLQLTPASEPDVSFPQGLGTTTTSTSTTSTSSTSSTSSSTSTTTPSTTAAPPTTAPASTTVPTTTTIVQATTTTTPAHAPAAAAAVARTPATARAGAAR
jgi:membrane peptidoglycan carboxypeptidase